jgi:hypothetical protein
MGQNITRAAGLIETKPCPSYISYAYFHRYSSDKGQVPFQLAFVSHSHSFETLERRINRVLAIVQIIRRYDLRTSTY